MGAMRQKKVSGMPFSYAIESELCRMENVRKAACIRDFTRI